MTGSGPRLGSRGGTAEAVAEAVAVKRGSGKRRVKAKEFKGQGTSTELNVFSFWEL